MFVGLASMLLAQASAAPGNDTLLCIAWFHEGDQFGSVRLAVDGDYTPRSLTLSIIEPDHWSRAEIVLDPTERRLPGQLSGAFFVVRYTRPPVFPLTMNVYADGALRWRKAISVPFWPTILGGTAESARGTSDYISRPDDGLPVPTPRELRIALTDARGQQIGETRYALPGAEPGGPMARALAAVEAGYRTRECSAPPPPID